MTNAEARQALEVGYVRSHGKGRGLTLCEFATGVHATLSEMARQSGFLWAIVLRAAAGAVTRWKQEAGCPR
jgi:hypothetical protein